MRENGKFVGDNGTIPEGQGIVIAQLNECHELFMMAMVLSISNTNIPGCASDPLSRY